jgi:uncharacterized protein (TIGR00369 family)
MRIVLNQAESRYPTLRQWAACKAICKTTSLPARFSRQALGKSDGKRIMSKLADTGPLTPADLAARAGRALLDQPFTRLVGAYMGEVSHGRVEFIVDNRPELTQNHGFIHGGIIGYLADNACGAAASTVLPKGAISLVTSEYKISLLRPATGERAMARAEVIKSGRRQCVAQAHVYCQDKGEEKLVAIALGTLTYIYPE